MLMLKKKTDWSSITTFLKHNFSLVSVSVTTADSASPCLAGYARWEEPLVDVFG